MFDLPPSHSHSRIRSADRNADVIPTVVLQQDESKLNNEVIDAISKLQGGRSEVFQRNAQLVGVVELEDPELPNGTLAIRPITEAILRERITQCCHLVEESTNQEGETKAKPKKPPVHMLRQILERGFYDGKIRPLTGIIKCPTLRPDGSILQSQGYDDCTGLILRPTLEFPTVPESPSKSEIHSSISKLRAAFMDFPFKADSDFAAYLSMILTMICRNCIDGPIPMFCITANIPGAGKTLLADAASTIAYGQPAAKSQFSSDANEMRKLVTVAAIESRSFSLLDNVDTTLRGSSLDAAITSTVWQDRILGKSESTAELPLKTIWAATGNNLSYGTDLSRRVLPIRLDSPLEAPEERNDFENENLLKFILENRAQLVVAAITILRGFFVDGKPEQPGGTFGSFDSWSEIIRNAIVWAGDADPITTREEAKASDESADQLAILIEGLSLEDPDREGLTSQQIAELVNSNNAEPALTEAIRMLCGGGILNNRRVGYQLRRFKGRKLKNAKIIAKSGRANRKLWTVEDLDSISMVTQDSYPSREERPSNMFSESGEKQTNHTQHANQCEKCGSPCVSLGELINGWRNVDCHECGFVRPIEISSEVG